MLRGASLVVVLVVLAVLAVPLGAVAGTDTRAAVQRDTSLETLVLQKINAVRAGRGLLQLSSSDGLSKAAAGHSRSMAVYGFFAHESKNGAPFWKRLKTAFPPRSNAWTVGENLAMFGGAKPGADAIVSSWMASPEHRANLLSRTFKQAGIAILYDPAADGVFGGEPTWVVTLDVGTR
jgi:uncharacterized protein YkwD